MEADNQAGFDSSNTRFGEHRWQLAIKVIDALNKLNINWMVDSGTLLGVIRDGVFLPHDDDFDIAIQPQGYLGSQSLNEICQRIAKELPHVCCRCVTSFAHTIEVYLPEYGSYTRTNPFYQGTDFHHVTVDLQIQLPWPFDNEYIVTNTGQAIDKSLIEPKSKMRFRDVMLNIPHQPKAYLKELYGSINPNATYDPLLKKWVDKP
ncbi:hypothetical protein D210916BOD24_17300 [Alteromonas sp. D210916BOD_24]|uniref:LicD family protein n=1 Tax=Alteromonas sp. D210916BOD_24 TaxID=3157618 RepID=UPI00399D25E5